MTLTLKTIRDFDPIGKRVLLRVDFNVPTDKDGTIQDDSRMTKALPTINYLLEKGAKLIIMSHLGRPDGAIKDDLKLDKIAVHLAKLLNKPVEKLNEATGPEVEQVISKMQNGEVVLLENTRFYPGEETNDPTFTAQLAKIGEVFVNDGFGVSHRKHASSYGIGTILPAYAGFLIEKEIAAMEPLMTAPKPPFTVIIGGAKIKDKIAIIEQFIPKADHILIGGGLANTFLAAQGQPVGQSLYEKDQLDLARTLIAKAKTPDQIMLPTDIIIATEISNTAPTQTVAPANVPAEAKILDIGPATITTFAQIISASQTILWNGPLGLTEFTPFQNGTKKIADAVKTATAQPQSAHSVLGGGDTGEVLQTLGFTDSDFSHISTGGGASLEFLSGKKLPGIEILYRE